MAATCGDFPDDIKYRESRPFLSFRAALAVLQFNSRSVCAAERKFSAKGLWQQATHRPRDQEQPPSWLWSRDGVCCVRNARPLRRNVIFHIFITIIVQMTDIFSSEIVYSTVTDWKRHKWPVREVSSIYFTTASGARARVTLCIICCPSLRVNKHNVDTLVVQT